MICHDFNTVFVHIPKTAGQSIEHAFLRLLGLDWETRAALLLRPNDQPRLGPPRLAHLKAAEYVKYHHLSQQLYDQYFVFSFVRNPWSRVTSMYRYLSQYKDYSLPQYVEGPLRDQVRDGDYFTAPQSQYIYHKEKPIVDFVGRFESLQKDFDEICLRIKAPQLKLPHANASKINGSMPNDQNKLAWTTTARDLVGELYAEDISNFEYEFPYEVKRTVR